MKKTITLLLAAAGIAAGATTPVELEWDSTNAAALDANTFANDEISVVFTMDLKKLSSVGGDIFTISGTVTTYTTTYGLTHTYESDWMMGDYNELWAIEKGSASGALCYDLAVKNPSFAEVVYTYGAGTFVAYMNFYNKNGALVNAKEYTWSGDFKDFTSVSMISSSVEKMDVYNTVIQKDDVQSAIDYYYNPTTPGDGNVPEPTTATLSLLALAGLAARRRRK